MINTQRSSIELYFDPKVIGLEQVASRFSWLQLIPIASPPDQPDPSSAMIISTATSIANETGASQLPGWVFCASSGVDHVKAERTQLGELGFYHARGCNASAVAEYVLASVGLWCREKDQHISKVTLGVVGYGAVGKKVCQLLSKFVKAIEVYDPWVQVPNLPNIKAVSKKQILTNHIVSLHMPALKQSSFPTFHWLEAQDISLARFQLLINAARGDLLSPQAYSQLAADSQKLAVIDTHYHEPDNFDSSSGQWITTGHIAGQTYQARMMAVKMALNSLVRWAVQQGVKIPLKQTYEQILCATQSQIPSPSPWDLDPALVRSEINQWGISTSLLAGSVDLQALSHDFQAQCLGKSRDDFARYRKEHLRWDFTSYPSLASLWQ